MSRAAAGPRYRHRPSVVVAGVCSLLLGRPRRLSADAEALLSRIRPAPQVYGQEHIPPQAPFILVVNHYSRPGLDAGWGPLLIQLTVRRRRGQELHWPMTNAWIYPPSDRLGNWVLEPVTRRLFPRIARIYGLVPMPPMPPRPQDVVDRAMAVRELLALARDPHTLIALAPEGRDSPDGGLIKPPPGVGRLIAQLAWTGRLILPIGVAERDGVLTARFGEPFELRVTQENDKRELDDVVATQVMAAIGRLLPPEMWGTYADVIGRGRVRG